MDPTQSTPMNEDSQHSAPYAFYPPSDEDHAYGLVYPPPMQNYGLAQPPAHPQQPDLQQQAMQYQRSLAMLPPHQQQHQQPPQQQQYANPVYNASPPHGILPSSGSPPPSPNIYDPLSGSDTSAEATPYRSHSRGSDSSTGSPSSSRGNSLVHRNPLRYNPTPSPTSSSGRRSRGRSFSDEEDSMMGVSLAEHLANTRKEATRRQRIEAEQRRRDELRDGYARLKDVLPVSNQKSSKVSLLERATNHILQLEKSNLELQGRLANIEMEVQRLRNLNEKISLGGTKSDQLMTPSHIMDPKPLSPPPSDHGSSQHSRISMVNSHPLPNPRDDSSPSASEPDY